MVNFIEGIGLLTGGFWLTIVQAKFFKSGKSDALGGHGSMLMCGIGLIIFGIILLVKFW